MIEEVLEGSMCEDCGSYLGKAVGHRRSCCSKIICPTCKREFSNEHNLNQHLFWRHRFVPKTSEKKFQCRVCLRRFKTETALADHSRFVHERKKKNG